MDDNWLYPIGASDLEAIAYIHHSEMRQHALCRWTGSHPISMQSSWPSRSLQYRKTPKPCATEDRGMSSVLAFSRSRKVGGRPDEPSHKRKHSMALLVRILLVIGCGNVIARHS
jgi:hypothetical protein